MTTNWPFPNRKLPDGTWECGTKDAAIWFKLNGSVHLRRRSRSLKASWRSVAGRLGAVDEKIKALSTEQSSLYDSAGNRVDEFGAPLDPVVFDLASAPFRKKAVVVALPPANPPPNNKPNWAALEASADQWLVEHPTANSVHGKSARTEEPLPPTAKQRHRRRMHGSAKEIKSLKDDAINFDLTNVLAVLGELMTETVEREYKRKCANFVGQMDAAWAIRHRASIHQRFLDELIKLCQELHHPPTKSMLAYVLKIDAARVSQLCKELCFDWLPTKKRGPK